MHTGLTDNPTCERCLQEDESATHILCDFEAIAYLRFRHLGQFFIEPSDYYDAPINKVLHRKRKHNRSLKVAVQGPDFMAHPLYLHTYIHNIHREAYSCLWCRITLYRVGFMLLGGKSLFSVS
jgi:hypothetical protein